MKADYDSEADALAIELIEVDRWDNGEGFDEDYCNLGFLRGRLVYVGLLSPRENLHLLGGVAESYDLDSGRLMAIAKAALAAPDQPVTVGGQLAA